MAKDKFAIDFLMNKNNYYLSGNSSLGFLDFGDIEPKDIALYRVDEISFEDKAPRKEALENVLSALKIDGINFIYLILGDDSGVHFYYGVAKDQSAEKDLDLSIYDIGKYILEPSIKGNFRGSKTEEVKPDCKRDIMDTISNMRYYSMLEGVPGYTKDDEKFQGVDRLVDVMLGDVFGFMIVASPLNYDEIKNIEADLYEVYTRVVPLSKKSVQDGTSTNTGISTGITKGSSKTEGKTYTKGSNESINITDGTNSGSSKGTSKSTTSGTNSSSGGSSSSSGKSNSTTNEANEGISNGKSHSESKTTGGSKSEGSSVSNAVSESASEQKNEGSGTSSSATLEYVDKKAQDWIKYLDDVIIPRLDYGTGKGIFVTASFMFSNNKASLKKLENTAISLYSGEKGNKIPLKAVSLENREKNKTLAMLKRFQLPCASFKNELTTNELIARSALSQYVSKNGGFGLGNWITTNELAMIAGLPQKDVVGLGLKEEIEFGLNFESNIADDDKITLGKLVQSGNIIDKIDVFIDKNNLDKHIFITGVTGSGKTTTCHKILIDSDLPFLVIEPAKTEYRILADKYDDLIVFTLGKDTVTPFRLNPFEFFRHESITSRVDMIRASIEASFDMEAAIPQLIESAIYACYKDYGWDISTNKNKIYGDSAFDDGVYAFPTLEDLINKVDVVVDEQGFDVRLRNDYIGSIKARLQGLLMGSKGLMLNTRRSVDFEDLLERRVVLEFEEIRSATEKSLVMGFVLTNLMEAIKARFLKYGAFHHITLVEEAHRLLSKFAPGDSPNKKHGVETFSDMLAEIRKYGESLVIVDQIPNKLTPEVLKNTNTKIVHKLFAEDDKEAIGNTIVLSREQKEFLSNLDTGRAVVFTQGFNKALQVQINNITNTTSSKQISEATLREMVLRYYADNYKKGIIYGAQLLDSKPSLEQVDKMIELLRDKTVSHNLSLYCSCAEGRVSFDDLIKLAELASNEVLNKFIADFNKKTPKINEGYAEQLKELKNKYGRELMCLMIYAVNRNGVKNCYDEKRKELESFVESYIALELGGQDAMDWRDKFLLWL